MKALKRNLLQATVFLTLWAFAHSYLISAFPNPNLVDIGDYFFALDADDKNSLPAFPTPLLQAQSLVLQHPGFARAEAIPAKPGPVFSEWASYKNCRSPPPQTSAS